MTFRVAARTLLHLGAELISSDGVAFYELIKNGLDAGSPFVRLDVVCALPHLAYRELREEISKYDLAGDVNKKGDSASYEMFDTIREKACKSIDPKAITSSEAISRLSDTVTWEQLRYELDTVFFDLNHIVISDAGAGMSLQDLLDIYLVIGTPARFLEREQWKEEVGKDDASSGDRQRPIHGEKGVGRLSAMRLGDCLHVKSTRTGEKHWNELDIDWSLFQIDVNAFIEDVPIQPRLGAEKDNPKRSGTTIIISKLQSNWSREKLDYIVRTEFSKLVDPFTPGVKFPVKVFFNDQELLIPRFNRILFEHAHATIKATYTTNPDPRISGRIWYIGNRRQPGSDRETTFMLERTHLVSTVGGMLPQEYITIDTLVGLGPFTLTVYWYNRQRLSAIEGIGNLKAVRDLLRRWAGGVMVYRDGFRVSPYGNLEDDWLDLDKRALAYRSFKVNRAQIIGIVDITSPGNPGLVDQTNREGLRDTVQKRVLVRLLKWVIEDQLLGFLNAVDKEKPIEGNLDLDDLDERVQRHGAELDQMLTRLSLEHPEIDQEYQIRTLVVDNRKVLSKTMKEVRRRAEAYETGRTQLVHLAGVGLLVEVLAHELNRATAHTLDTLNNFKRQDTPDHLRHAFSTLEAQLRSLQKRLLILDPLSTRGRQVKETFDLVDWVQETLDAHQAQFHRHNIRLQFWTKPEINAIFKVHAVKGMMVQILENLISNSVYWLKQERRLVPSFKPEIQVTIDTIERQVRFSDNGPGIEPERQELVFEAFHSTKPPGTGSGLGLFIAREIAEYHNTSLYLDPTTSGPHHTLNTLVFDLKPMQRDQSGGTA